MANLSAFENPWDDHKKGDSGTTKNVEDAINKIKGKFRGAFGATGTGKDANNCKDGANEGGNTSGTSWYDKAPFHGHKAVKLVISLFLCWLCSGFFTVDTNEEGIVLLMGVYNRTVGPGLNYHLPFPFEDVEKVNVTRLNKDIVGLRTLPGYGQNTTGGQSIDSMHKRGMSGVIANLERGALSGALNMGDGAYTPSVNDEHMLTGDENMIDLQFFVQWYVKDAKDYLFNIKDEPNESTVRMAAESAMREVIGGVKLYDALSEKREFIEKTVKNNLQQMLNAYKTGVQVDALGILYSYVAPDVMDAYRDVQSAKADKEREINGAYAYRNEIIPKARGEAQAIIESANAYSESTTAKARGEASRYLAVLAQYKNAKATVRQRIYIDTMTKVLANTRKIVLGDSGLRTGSHQCPSVLPLPIIGMDGILKVGSSDSSSAKTITSEYEQGKTGDSGGGANNVGRTTAKQK